MSAAGSDGRGRETRLLLGTIAVSVVVLVVLAQFRFPEEVARETAEPAPAPLERLAARATYEELATTMADLERRLGPRLVVVRVLPERESGGFAVAPRMTDERAVAVLDARETISPAADDDTSVALAARDSRDLAVLTVGHLLDGSVTAAPATPRPGPRYVAVAEATARGPLLRPIYIGRTDMATDPRTGTPTLVAAADQPIPRGAAVFSLSGNFIGLVTAGGMRPVIAPADVLRGVAVSAQPTETRGDFAVEAQALTSGLARATGAERGVVVSYVHPQGPSAGRLEPGDVVVSIDGINVTTPDGFARVEQGRTPGATGVLQVIRRGAPIEVRIPVRDATGLPLPALPADDSGMVLRTIPALGAEVAAVQPGGAAARAGLVAGDIVTSIDGRAEPSAEALLRAFRALEPGSAALLAVRRGQRHLVVALEKPR
jgi:S1-C subfamily serine protease